MTTAMLRKPIITVVGHVDAGKTKLLDSIRGTAIAEKEVGGITQHIGATEVPIEVITKLSGDLPQKYGFKINVPGLLFIDTPGHEAFTNLRKRGGSIADLAVIVVDVLKGFQPQTYEALEILRSYKTPFIVVVNKVDLVQGWHVKQGSLTANLREQSADVLHKLDELVYKIVGQLFEKGVQSDRFDSVRDFTKQVAIIPISAKQKIGIEEVLMFLAGMSQKYLEKNLKVHVTGPAKGTVLEVKEEKGLGTTIDAILYDGSLKVGQEIVVGGKAGIIKAKVRALLEPKPLQEIRNATDKFRNVQEVHAAAGVKISAPGLDNALAGSPLRAVVTGEEEKQVMDEIKRVTIESDAIGPIVRADALGSLEAITRLLEGRGLKVKKADVGAVSRRDVMEIESVKEKDVLKGVIFAFHTKVDEVARQEAEKRGIKVFSGEVIYQLLDDYAKWTGEEKQREKTELLQRLTMPAKFEILRDHVFRNSKPAIVGIKVLEGRLRQNVQLINGKKIVGKISAMQEEGENVEEAKAGDEVAISIDKGVIGRNILEGDVLYTLIPEKQLQELENAADLLTQGEIALIDEIKQMQRKLKGGEEE